MLFPSGSKSWIGKSITLHSSENNPTLGLRPRVGLFSLSWIVMDFPIQLFEPDGIVPTPDYSTQTTQPELFHDFAHFSTKVRIWFKSCLKLKTQFSIYIKKSKYLPFCSMLLKKPVLLLLFICLFHFWVTQKEKNQETRLKRLSVSKAASVFFDLHQFTLICINLLWLASIYFDLHHFTLIWINLLWFASIYFSLHQFTFVK